MFLRRIVIVAIASALGWGAACHSPSARFASSPVAAGKRSGEMKPESAQVTICFSGRSLGNDPYRSGGNPELGALCAKLPSLVRDTRGRDAAYPFFRWNSDVDHAVDVLVANLDTDGDGAVTSADRDVDINVVGFSWGGFNALDLIEKVGEDPRFSATRRRVARFFALDPYRTDALVFARRTLEVPPYVDELWEFRHTIAPEQDCSLMFGGLIGPFTGRNPRCTGHTVCHDFDYSLNPSTSSVDHCAIPRYSAGHILRIVSGAELRGAPRERQVVRY